MTQKILFNKLIDLAVSWLKKLQFRLSLQDILLQRYPEGSHFYIVQIGAHDGISHDFLFDFFQKRSPRGILLEPVQDYYNKLLVNFEKFEELIKINCALHPTDKEIIINRIAPAYEKEVPFWALGSASLFKENLTKHNIEEYKIIEERVKAVSYKDILESSYQYDKIDLIQIDTEGFDYEILKMIDFSKIKPRFIKYEFANLHHKDAKDAKKLLLKEGYIFFAEEGDIIAINSSKLITKLILKFY